ncbi:MAG TPA: EAL domain-containing protein [Gemmatimonadales bacterium]|nr:EAL domain-containing protein [Gemmatimonadales bacterium]
MRSFPGGERILESAIRTYLRESTEIWDALRNACAVGDRETVQRITHNLKSSSAMLGATRLASLYQGLEQEAASSAAADLTQRLETIREEYGLVERELRALEPQRPTEALPASSDRAPLVLVVDDESTSRVILGGLLRADGFDVQEASDGATALQRVVALRPDLVLLDVVMPGMDGFEVCASIRAKPEVALTPVVMVTALDDQHALARAFEVGATDFITKPVAPALLTHRVRFVLRMSAALEEARHSEARLAEAQRIARVGNWEWHVPTGVFRGSAEAARLLGLGSDATHCPIDCVYQQVAEDEQELLRQELEAAAAGAGSRLDREYRVPVDGGERHVHLLGEAVPGDQGLVRVAGTVQDITARVETQRRIQTLAYHDALTGLPNRRLFADQLHRVLSAARRRQRRAAVILVDLDDFKRINDTLGHSVGDQVLSEVAGRLRDAVRAYDTVGREMVSGEPATVARLGGDEFLVAVADLATGEDAAIVAGRLLKAFSDHFVVAGQDLFVSASLGISVYPEDGEDLESLLKHADVALYQAKAAGRNTGEFFNASMNAAALQRLHLETNLRRAIERDEITVLFQPQIDTRIQRMIGVEALLRWTHPELGRIPPAQFVPVAERIGLIDDLTELALRRTCGQLADWRREGFEPLRASVNLSPHLLRRPDTIHRLASLPAALEVDPSSIEFEITESALMEKPQDAERVLTELRGRGFRLALDDFGTGYSSLSYLRRFPLDTLKIDRAFVRDIADENGAAIVAAVITLARSLQLEPLAEGVESEVQRGFLLQHGCDLMQGYLFGRPMSAKEIGELLTRGNLPA